MPIDDDDILTLECVLFFFCLLLEIQAGKTKKNGNLAHYQLNCRHFHNVIYIFYLFHNRVLFKDVFTFKSRFPALFFLNVILLEIELH